MWGINLWSWLPIGFPGGWIGKWIVIAVVGVGAYWGHNTFIKRKAVKAFIADSKEEGRKNNAVSRKIRADGDAKGALDRLRNSDCRDCN